MRSSLFGAVLAALASGAAAQNANFAPADAPADQPAQQPPSAPSTPLLPSPQETFSAIGRFIDQSISNVGAGVKGAGDAVGGATNAAGSLAKGVGEVARIPLAPVVAGWERCAVAANGAPDCEIASVALCKAKGYPGGRSVDITTSFKCPAAVWLERREPSEPECVNESFVSKAICQ